MMCNLCFGDVSQDSVYLDKGRIRHQGKKELANLTNVLLVETRSAATMTEQDSTCRLMGLRGGAILIEQLIGCNHKFY